MSSRTRSVAVLGCPGTAKSTFGLSAPGVEQHVWGSNEDTSADNFASRTDILPAKRFNWYECLTDVEKAKFTDEKVSEIEIGTLSQIGRARNIARYRRYLYTIKNDKLAGKRPELKTIFLDNGTPFSQDFEDYVRQTFKGEFETKEGNFNSIAFAMKFHSEFSDFMRMMGELGCDLVASFHIKMALDQADAAKANFLTDAQKGIKYVKEWQPLVMGQVKYALAGMFDYVFYMWTEEAAGQNNKYLAKLEADDSTVGTAKGRYQPFDNPRRIVFPKNEGWKFLDDAIKVYKETGKPVSSGK